MVTERANQDLGNKLQVRVRNIEILTPAVKLFELVSADGPLPGFMAGAHIDVTIGDGSTRSYSLLNPLGDFSHYSIAVQREAGGTGGSQWMHESVAAGDLLHIAAPRNTFALSKEARSHTLIAGGIGITPILAMARRLHADDADLRLYYCTRCEADAPFLAHLRALLGDRLIAHFGGGERTRRLDLKQVLRERAEAEHLYVCGPAEMIEAARQAAGHWPSGTVHFELFQGATAAPAATDTGFEVVLAKSNVTLTVPAGKSILSVLLDHGLPIEFSCEEGICGMCTTRVLSGKVEHRDHVLSDAEKVSNTFMQVCVSRPLPGERLVLDL